MSQNKDSEKWIPKIFCPWFNANMETFLLKFVRWYDKIGSNMIFSCYCHQRVHFRIHIRIISKVVIEIKIKRINLWIKKRKKILLQKFKSFTKFNYRIFKTFLINNCIKFIAILCFGGGIEPSALKVRWFIQFDPYLSCFYRGWKKFVDEIFCEVS